MMYCLILMQTIRFVANGTLLDTDEKTWDFSFDLNVKSMYRMCRAFIPKVRRLFYHSFLLPIGGSLF